MSIGFCHDRDTEAYRNVNIHLHGRLTLVTPPTTRPDNVLLVRVLLPERRRTEMNSTANRLLSGATKCLLAATLVASAAAPIGIRAAN
jgi:hypothetical protein